jgi:hypothetical protein
MELSIIRLMLKSQVLCFGPSPSSNPNLNVGSFFWGRSVALARYLHFIQDHQDRHLAARSVLIEYLSSRADRRVLP